MVTWDGRSMMTVSTYVRCVLCLRCCIPHQAKKLSTFEVPQYISSVILDDVIWSPKGHQASQEPDILGERHAKLYIQYCACWWPGTVRWTSTGRVVTKFGSRASIHKADGRLTLRSRYDRSQEIECYDDPIAPKFVRHLSCTGGWGWGSSKVVVTFNHEGGSGFPYHRRGFFNNPIFLNFGWCAAYWARFMCHHELWQHQ